MPWMPMPDAVFLEELLSGNSLTQEMSVWQEKDKILHNYYENITHEKRKKGYIFSLNMEN